MKLNKKVIQSINKLTANSFNDQGKLRQSWVSGNLKAFSGLPSVERIRVLSEYLRGLKREIKRRTLIIESDRTITLSQEREIVRLVEKEFIVSQTHKLIDASLLGGIRVKIGDTVFDDCVAGKIDQLRESINV